MRYSIGSMLLPSPRTLWKPPAGVSPKPSPRSTVKLNRVCGSPLRCAMRVLSKGLPDRPRLSDLGLARPRT